MVYSFIYNSYKNMAFMSNIEGDVLKLSYLICSSIKGQMLIILKAIWGGEKSQVIGIKH